MFRVGVMIRVTRPTRKGYNHVKGMGMVMVRVGVTRSTGKLGECHLSGLI